MSELEQTILIVDDEPSNLESLERIFRREGYQVLCAPGGQPALDLLRSEPVNVVLTDLMMPDLSGLDLLRAVQAVAPEVEVVMMTAYATVENAVEAMRAGAYDFVTKPLKRNPLTMTVRRALEKQTLILENRRLRERLAADREARGIIGRSPAMHRTLEVVRQAAPTSATILLQGESGTGKELVAHTLHELSPRESEPFVVVNCAALPESILESELFGYEKGAFTGADRRREGRIERAHRGTLFLDEVGELSPGVQAKLLRVLQEGEFERLGGGRPQSVDFRLIAATNRDLEEEVRAGRFREDLFYRLNVVAITLPSLRERRGDVPLLAAHFRQRYVEKHGKPVNGIARRALDALERYRWPGNVRELENIIERAIVLTKNEVIDLEDLPEAISGAPPAATNRDGSGRQILIPLGMPLADVERVVIEETLRETGGDKNLAARLLGIASRTIYRKLEGYS